MATISNAQGLLFADGFYWDLDDETRAFSRRFFAANGNVQMPSTSIGAEYSAVLHYLKAVAAVGSTEARR